MGGRDWFTGRVAAPTQRWCLLLDFWGALYGAHVEMASSLGAWGVLCRAHVGMVPSLGVWVRAVPRPRTDGAFSWCLGAVLVPGRCLEW